MTTMIHDINVGALAVYLQAQGVIAGGSLSAEKFPGGQSNPTFAIAAEGKRYVLRRKPPGQLLKSAHAIDREYRVMGALWNADFPVPKMVHYCTDASVIGSEFYLMEHVDGRILWQPSLPGVSNRDRSEIFDAMNATLAALHSIDIEKAGLGDFSRRGDAYFERQLTLWIKQYRASETHRIDELEAVMDYLQRALPPCDGHVVLCDGDYRLDNMILHPEENRVIAVIDWELSSLGHPLADLAYQCMQWRLPVDCALAGLGGIDRAELGIPPESQYVDQYCERRNIAKPNNWHFYLVFSYFRLAAILQGVVRRSIGGNSSSARAAAFKDMIQPIAADALALTG